MALDGEIAGAGAWIAAAIGVLVLTSIFALMVETLPDLTPGTRRALDCFEAVIATVFALEYAARCWLAGAPGGWRGRLRWMVSPIALLDLLAVASGLVALTGAQVDATRLLRMARLLRLIRLPRYTEAVATLGRVVWAKRGELMVIGMLVATLLLVFAVGIHHAEHEAQPERFISAFDGLWWSVITLTTIGYGDVYPMTTVGRIIGACAALLGVGLITLPAGIIATGFLEEVKLRDHRRRDRLAAAGQHCPHCGMELPDSPTEKNVGDRGPGSHQH